MVSPPVLKSLRLRNLLSFGAEGSEIELRPLNVIIGPNGSGKSNLIEAISLLRAAPRDLVKDVHEGGVGREWLWKGAEGTPTATIEAVLDYSHSDPDRWESSLRYRLSFTEVGERFQVTDERIEDATIPPGPAPPGATKPLFYFGYERGRPTLVVVPTDSRPGGVRELGPTDLDPQQSILSQRRDPDLYPELTHVGRHFELFQLYRNWSFGRPSKAREFQYTDLPNEFLAEDLSNLGLVVSKLRNDRKIKEALQSNLQKLYEDAREIDLVLSGGRVQVAVQERDYTIPATRLSDGTLRWIALLTILLHPSPPPLVCIEEPELGLHPDMIPTLATLLREASERMQLIVTTHSDTLVDALSDTPESVIVCEKENGATTLKRLGKEELSAWLEKYTLGQLWRSGEIGGNRW